MRKVRVMSVITKDQQTQKARKYLAQSDGVMTEGVINQARVHFPLRSLNYTGVFHGFMQEANEDATYVVAIVEDSKGVVTTPLAETVEFENAEV